MEDEVNPIDRAALASLPPAALRALLPGFLSQFVADPAASARNREQMAAQVDNWSDETCARVIAFIVSMGTEHHLYAAVPECQKLARQWTREVLLTSEVHGVEHLRAAATRGPTLLVSNHLSYFDTTATDAILAFGGHRDLADRLVAAAGPKVYQDGFRLVAASGLSTLPVPQSTSFSHTEKLSPRELARKVTESMAATGQILEAGHILLLYPEGSRSRNGRFGPFLKGTHRYLSCVEPLFVVPMAIWGTERIMPVSEAKLHPGPVGIAFAPPLAVGPDGDAREVLGIAHRAIQRLLPEPLRPLAIAAESA